MAETNTTTQTTEATSQPAEKPQNNAPAPAEGNDTKGQETTSQSAAQPAEKTFTQDELNINLSIQNEIDLDGDKVGESVTNYQTRESAKSNGY